MLKEMCENLGSLLTVSTEIVIQEYKMSESWRLGQEC